jgi:hypothetical protein
MAASVDTWIVVDLALSCLLPWLVHSMYRTYATKSSVDDSAQRAGLHSRRAAVEQGAQAVLIMLLALNTVAHYRGVTALLAPTPGAIVIRLVTLVSACSRNDYSYRITSRAADLLLHGL